MKKAFALLALFAGSLVGSVAGAVPVVKDEDKGIVINVGILAQPWFQATAPGSNGAGPGACGSETRDRCSAGIGNARGDGPAFDLFLRRARLMVWGSATKEISFFVDTDEPNLGKGGSFATTTFIQDAFLTYSFAPEFRIDTGLFLSPLSHHTLEGATSLDALDYHSDEIRFPTGRIFRDVGVQFRGLAAQEHFHYRLAVTEGVRNGALPAVPAGEPARPVLNPGSVPRVTVQLRGNIVGSEPDFFFKGIYFSDKPIVSVGLGGDWQSKSVVKLDHKVGDYAAGSLDVFAEIPFTANDELVAKANYFIYAQGASQATGSTMIQAGATAYYAEAGFRHAWLEPLIFVEGVRGWKNSVSILAPHAGVNFWILKHNFNIKTDLGYKRTEEKNEATKKDILWTTQAQLFF